ncbi:MAG: PadR family transcriptional regulator [Pseudomonadales bacterium]|nr:PadR family transcriptional regulator [Pseudomonadales bacterium]
MSLRHALLALVDLEPGTGYDLMNRIEKSIGFFWPATHQQVYKELHQLQELGWVDVRVENQSGKPDRRVYTLREAGIHELKSWLTHDSSAAKIRDPFLLRVFAAHRMEPETLRQQLNHQKNLHTATLSLYQSIDERLDSAPEYVQERYRFARHTLRLGIYFEQAWLRWCEELGELA